MKYIFNTLPDTAEVAEFNIDPLTRDQDEWGVFRVRVVRVGGEDEWVIRRHLKYLRKDSYPNVIEWTSIPNDENIFTLEEALATAEEIIWRLSMNGITAAELIRQHYPALENRIP